jgi:hypothetical protein
MDNPEHSSDQQQQVKAIWHSYLTTGDRPECFGLPWFMARWFRPYIKLLP